MAVATTPDQSLVVERTPSDQMLTASLVVGPLLYLVADTVYAVRGWTDPTAGILHVLGAIGYGLVVLRVADWLPRRSLLAAGLVFTAVAGSIGNAAYGFDTIHRSLGDVALVDQSGAAVLIKPLGLIFPLSLALVAYGLRELRYRVPALLALVAAVGWPVAHIANLGPLAVGLNVLLVVAFGSVAWTARGVPSSSSVA